MSMEIHVVFHGKLPSKAALTRCFKEFRFPLSFQRGRGLLEQHKGLLPMRLRGDESGVEFDTFDGRKAVEEIAGKRIDPSFTRAASFRWGAAADAGIVAQCFAAALAKLVNGMVIDPQLGRVLVAEQGIASAQNLLKASASKPKLPGTRPADVRRYLKPLLQQRSDLVLVGRFLLIRPIRHLLRGAFLDRSSDEFELRLIRECGPLYDMKQSAQELVLSGAFEVWQPHFEALLMSCLAENVFDAVGNITTFIDFTKVKPPIHRDLRKAHITCLLLAGERDRAAALVEQAARDPWQERRNQPIRHHWENLTRDIAATCAEYHAKEAATVRKLKLERFWEASPFPVELPAAHRADRTAETPFITTPWPQAPHWLWRGMPQCPGEVCYAKDCRWREESDEDEDIDLTPERVEGLRLLVVLTPAEAKERHDALEGYEMAARLVDGRLLLVSRRTSHDRLRPPNPSLKVPEKPRQPDIHVTLFGLSHVAFATFARRNRDEGSLVVESFGAQPYTGKRSWECFLDLDQAAKRIHDERTGELIVTEATVKPDERDLAIVPKPEFGQYAPFVERLRILLGNAGYGEVS